MYCFICLCSNFSGTSIFIEQNTVIDPSETDFSFNNEHNNKSLFYASRRQQNCKG